MIGHTISRDCPSPAPPVPSSARLANRWCHRNRPGTDWKDVCLRLNHSRNRDLQLTFAISDIISTSNCTIGAIISRQKSTNALTSFSLRPLLISGNLRRANWSPSNGLRYFDWVARSGRLGSWKEFFWQLSWLHEWIHKRHQLTFINFDAFVKHICKT